MKTYQIQLLNCNNHNIEISKYLQIMTEIRKKMQTRLYQMSRLYCMRIWMRNVRDILRLH